MRYRRQLAMVAFTVVTLYSAASQPNITTAKPVAVSDHDADDPPLQLAKGVKEQIQRELIFLQQIRPKIHRSERTIELERGERGEREGRNKNSKITSNKALSNLAFLDLSNNEKANLEAKFKAFGIQQSNDAATSLKQFEESIQKYLTAPPTPEEIAAAEEEEVRNIVEKLADDFKQQEEIQEIKAEMIQQGAVDDEPGEPEIGAPPLTRQEEQKLVKIVEEVSDEHEEDDQQREKQYDEMLTDDEQEKLENLIKWMSIQQTCILACLAAVSIAAVIMCAWRTCRENSHQREQQMLENEDSLVYGERYMGKNNPHSSPVTFRNLVRRSDKDFSMHGSELLGDLNSTSEIKTSKEVPTRLAPMINQPDYLYSDDTPSFMGGR